MKAADWAAKFTDEGADADECLRAFVGEIGDIARKRGGSTLAIQGAVREQRDKWRAACRLAPTLDPKTFDQILAYFGADYKRAEDAVLGKGKARPAATPPPPAAEGVPGRGLAEGIKKRRYNPVALKIGEGRG